MIELFYSDNCPYCKKVIDYLESNYIKYIPKNINNPEYYNELLRTGGISQVPFMFDRNNGKALYESDKIISYLKIPGEHNT